MRSVDREQAQGTQSLGSGSWTQAQILETHKEWGEKTQGLRSRPWIVGVWTESTDYGFREPGPGQRTGFGSLDRIWGLRVVREGFSHTTLFGLCPSIQIPVLGSGLMQRRFFGLVWVQRIGLAGLKPQIGPGWVWFGV